MSDFECKNINALKIQVNNFLKTLSNTLECDINDLKVKVSAELEFYLVNKKGEQLNENLTLESETIKYLNEVLMTYDYKLNKQNKLNQQNEIVYKTKNSNEINDTIKKDKTQQIRVESLEEEDGHNQFEVQFMSTTDPAELAQNIINFKKIINETVDVTFLAKPFEKEPTSSLHFHISVYYKDVNLFAKDNPHDESEYHYLPLYWCIAGLLDLMPKFIKYFAPTKNCRERYILPKREQKYIHYPTRICWGFNNRTCAIRIPRKPNEDPLNCRIEHRVSSSMADPYLALYAIFYSMQYGVEQELDAPEPIYTRAFEDDEAGQLIIELFDKL